MTIHPLTRRARAIVGGALVLLLPLCVCSAASANLTGTVRSAIDGAPMAQVEGAAGAATQTASSAGSAVTSSPTTGAAPSAPVSPLQTARTEAQPAVERVATTVEPATRHAVGTVQRVAATADSTAEVATVTVERTAATVAQTTSAVERTTSAVEQTTTATGERITATGERTAGATLGAVSRTTVTGGRLLNDAVGDALVPTTIAGAPSSATPTTASGAPATLSSLPVASAATPLATPAAPVAQHPGGAVAGWTRSAFAHPVALVSAAPLSGLSAAALSTAALPASAAGLASEQSDGPALPQAPSHAPLGGVSNSAAPGFSTALILFTILATVALLSGPRRGSRLLPASRAPRPQPFVLLSERPG